MARMKNKRHNRLPTKDSISNFEARIGLSNADNMLANSTYTTNFTSRNRVVLENAYRSSWLAAMAIDTKAEDMTREGVDVISKITPEQSQEIQQHVTDLSIWVHLCDALKWSRLYGTSIAVHLIDGQDMETPLDPETIGVGQYKGLEVIDRWGLQLSSEKVTDYGSQYGEPLFYTVVEPFSPLHGKKIHYTRLIRFDGVKLPRRQKALELGFGQSVLERLWDRMVAFDSATEGMSQLVFKAHLRTFKVEGLRENVLGAMDDGTALNGLVRNVDMMRRYQSNEGITLIDGADDFQTQTYTFSGLPDVIARLGEQVSGSLQIPLVRLFGQPPSGLNSSGESDLRTYNDGLAREQVRDLQIPVNQIYDFVSRSLFGSPLPKETKIKFRPLWQMSNIERGQYASTIATAVSGLETAGTISQSVALKELKQSSEITGIFSNITDKDIEDAANVPTAPSPNLGQSTQGQDDNTDRPKGGLAKILESLGIGSKPSTENSQVNV